MNKEEIIQKYNIDISKNNNSLEINFEMLKHEVFMMDLVVEATKSNYKDNLSPTLTIEEGSLLLRWKINSLFNKEYNISAEKEKLFGEKTSEIYLEVKRLNKLLVRYNTKSLKLNSKPNSEMSLNYVDVDVHDILYNGKTLNISTTEIAFDIFKKVRKNKGTNLYKNLLMDNSYNGESTNISVDGLEQNRGVNLSKIEGLEVHKNLVTDNDEIHEEVIQTIEGGRLKVVSIPRNKKKQSVRVEIEIDGATQTKTHEYLNEIVTNENVTHDYAEVDYEILGDKNGNNKRIRILRITKVYSNLKIEEESGPKFYNDWD